MVAAGADTAAAAQPHAPARDGRAIAWARSRITNGFLQALIGLFQAAKRKARSYRRLSTIRTVIFLIAGKLDFRALDPQVA